MLGKMAGDLGGYDRLRLLPLREKVRRGKVSDWRGFGGFNHREMQTAMDVPRPAHEPWYTTVRSIQYHASMRERFGEEFER